jgi:hypothetical protein
MIKKNLLKHCFNVLLIRRAYQCGIGQISFSFGAFFGQNVTFISMFALYASGSGKSEPFFGSGFGFHFRHYTSIYSF